MADSNRLFNPSYAQPKEKDPMLVQAPLKNAAHGAAAVTVNQIKGSPEMRVRHVGTKG